MIWAQAAYAINLTTVSSNQVGIGELRWPFALLCYALLDKILLLCLVLC